MLGPLSRGLLWAVCASALLLAGMAVALVAMYQIGVWTGQITPERQQEVQLMMALYFRVVALKGLLPQLLLGLALWPVVARWVPLAAHGRRGLALGLVLAASISFAVVGPLLLGADIENWPALQMSNAYQVVMSWLLMTAGVVAAAFFTRIWIPSLRPRYGERAWSGSEAA